KPAGSADRLAPMSFIHDKGISLLLTQQSLVEAAFEIGAKIVRIDSDWEIIDRQSGKNPQSSVSDENLGFIIYTAGSSGKSKRVMITHRGCRNHLLGLQEAVTLTEEDRVLKTSPIILDVSMLEMFWPLLAGACLVIAKPETYHSHNGVLELIVE